MLILEDVGVDRVPLCRWKLGNEIRHRGPSIPGIVGLEERVCLVKQVEPPCNGREVDLQSPAIPEFEPLLVCFQLKLIMDDGQEQSVEANGGGRVRWHQTANLV